MKRSSIALVIKKRAPKSRSLTEAVLLSAACSLLFVLVYGWTNGLASSRADLGECFFSWELRIPFSPVFIVPYLSIDLFFAASFLLCTNRVELRAHASRIALAILIAGVAFMLFPLTLGYARPDVSGWTGPFFHFLWSFDKPHNLAPSLHIALASLLWPVYARHTHRHLRWLVHGWFMLIVASPILTWQHHLLDVATGALLAQVCMFAVPEWRVAQQFGAAKSSWNRADNSSSVLNQADDGRRSSLACSSPNLRVARLYASAALAFGILAVALGTVFWLLLWPAISLSIIAIAYVRGNSSAFRKSGGGLPISTRLVLGPYLIGAFARRLFYRGRAEPWAEVAPGVYCGRLLNEPEALALRSMGVTSVLDLTAEHAETRAFRTIEYLNVPVLDLTRLSSEQLSRATSFITEGARSGGVYVHCALGISRSVAAVEAYLVSRGLKAGRTPDLQL